MTRSLPSDARRTVHEATLDLLSEVGMALEHETARETLRDAGASVEGTVVTLPPDLVESRLERAPSSFTWRARNPDRDVVVDAESDESQAITPGTGARNVLREGEDRRPATMADFETLVRLAHVAEPITCVGYDICSPEPYALPGDPGGFERAEVGYELLETLIRSTDKPLVGTARTAADARASVEMAGIALDDPDLDDPAILARVHPRSPRLYNEPIAGGLATFARAGQPLVISSGAMTGASAPRSLAETVVLANAETLFGVVLAQVVNPGTPVAYGYASTYYDPDSEGLAFGGPTANVLASMAVEMGTYYGLPTRVDGGVTDSKALDEQAGSESALKLSAALQGGADVILNATGLLDSYDTISPEKFVLDCERIQAIQSVDRDREAIVDRLRDGVSLSALRDAQTGRAFTDDRDRETLDDATFTSAVAVRGRYGQWEQAGAETAVQRASDRVDELLDAYERPPIDDDVAADLRRYVRDHAT